MRAYEDTGVTRKVEVLKQLVNMRLRNYGTVQEYINELVITTLKVKNAGLNIDDRTHSFINACRMILDHL